SGAVETWPIEQNKKAWNILQRLARRQRERVPVTAPRSGSAPGLPQYAPAREAERAAAALEATGKRLAEMTAEIEAAYAGERRPREVVGYMAGQPIPGEPPEPAPGEKRKLPPPPSPEQGGAPPGWRP